MIRIENLHYQYGERLIFDQVNLDFQPNQLISVIGRNGSGKTTLAQILSGLKPDLRGEVWLDDLRVRRSTSTRKLRQKVGLVMQNPDYQILFNRVYDEVEFALKNLGLPEGTEGLEQRREKLIQESLAQVGLANEVERNPRELSGGQKQRLNIATMLAMKPQYLVLDEATSMLDLPSREQLYRLLLELKARHGIIMMTNHLDEILLADHIIILDNATAHSYQKDELIAHPELLERYHLDIPLMLKLANKLKRNNYFDILAAVERMP